MCVLMVFWLLFWGTRIEITKNSGSESIVFCFGQFDVEDLVVISFPPLISAVCFLSILTQLSFLSLSVMLVLLRLFRPDFVSPYHMYYLCRYSSRFFFQSL